MFLGSVFLSERLNDTRIRYRAAQLSAKNSQRSRVCAQRIAESRRTAARHAVENNRNDMALRAMREASLLRSLEYLTKEIY